MKTIELPSYGIRVTLRTSDDGAVEGEIESDLWDPADSENHCIAAATLESFILSCACAGVDIEAPAFLTAIDTTVDALVNFT